MGESHAERSRETNAGSRAERPWGTETGLPAQGVGEIGAGSRAERSRGTKAGLRNWLAALEERDLLARITRTVDPTYEVAAVLSALDGERAALFQRVKDSDHELAGNTIIDRPSLALAVGCETRELAPVLAGLQLRPPSVRHLTLEQSGLSQRSTDLGGIPICKHHEGDAGRYLTSGVLVAREPEGARENWSINRLQAVGARRFRMLVLPGNLATLLASARRRDEELRVAVLIGIDPLALLASQIRGSERAVDGLSTYARLVGGEVGVVRLPGVELTIPADTEIAIEGVIPPGRLELEGPFGEFAKLYGPAAPGPVIEVRAVYERPEAIAQTILPGGNEHLLLGAAAREAGLFAALRDAGCPVAGVHFTPGGSRRFHAAVQRREGSVSAREIIRVALAYDRTLKVVLVVDEDIDVFSVEQLEWALATRFRPERDTVVLSGQTASSLDPTASAGRVAKVGLDATQPPSGRARTERYTNPMIGRIRLGDYVR